MSISKLHELFKYDQHVIRDRRDGSLYYRSEHNSNEAFIQFMMEDGERRCSREENEQVRRDFAVLQHVLLVVSATGKVPRTSVMNLDGDEQLSELDMDCVLRKFGCYEMIYGCTHFKNQMQADLVLSGTILETPEKYPEETQKLAEYLQDKVLEQVHFGFSRLLASD